MDNASETVRLQEDELTTILTKSISDAIYPFVVGLIHNDDLIGSGTLVRVGDRRGILTAYHVVHDARPKLDVRAGSSDLLGLIILAHEHVHRFELPLGVGVMTVVDIAKPTLEALGPDLTFLEIKPPHHLEQLLASKDFFSLSNNRETGLALNLTQNHPLVISGFYHEGYIVEQNEAGFSQVKGFKGFVGFTGIESRQEHAGYDLCDVTVNYSLEPDLPKSFGGYSGGGLWYVRLTKNKQTGKISHELPMFAGVVFYQQQVAANRKILRCHLTNSIYRHVVDAIHNS